MLIVFEKNKLASNSVDNIVGTVHIKQSIDLSQSNRIDLREVLTGNDIQWLVTKIFNFPVVLKKSKFYNFFS